MISTKTATRQIHFLLLIFATLTSLNGVAQTGLVDETFDARLAPHVGIYGVLLAPGGKILVTGDFTEIGGVQRRGLARLHPDGALDEAFAPELPGRALPPVSAMIGLPDGRVLTALKPDNGTRLLLLKEDGSIDSTFRAGKANVTNLYALAIQNDGKIIIGGNFQGVDAVPLNGIARLLPDGNVDLSFHPQAEGGGTEVGSILIQPDGKIFIAGYFTSFDGVPRKNFARLNPDGSLDQSFLESSGLFTSLGTATLDHDGKLLLGGFGFLNLDGPYRSLIRVNPDGSLDESFRGPDNSRTGRIFQTRVDQAGKIFIIGDAPILRLNADGSIDPAFEPIFIATLFPPLTSIALVADGKIIVGGGFKEVDNVERHAIARLNPSSLSAGVAFGGIYLDSLGSVFFEVDESVTNAVVPVRRYGALQDRVSVAFSTESGTAKEGIDFLPVKGRLEFASGQSNAVIQVPIIGDNLFTQEHRSFLIRLSDPTNATIFARLNTATVSIRDDDTTFEFLSPQPTISESAGSFEVGVSRAGPNSYGISSVEVDYAVVGGTATLGEDYQMASSGTLTFYTPFHGGVFSDGSISIRLMDDTVFEGNETIQILLSNPRGKGPAQGDVTLGLQTVTQVTIVDNDTKGADEIVRHAGVQPDGKILVGGSFARVNGVRRLGLARLLSDGSLDFSFDAKIQLSDAFNLLTRAAIVPLPDGKALIAGFTGRINGARRSLVARLNPDGGIDLSFDLGTTLASTRFGPGIYTVLPLSNGRIFIGGDFRGFIKGGRTINREGLARLEADGSVDTSFDLSTVSPAKEVRIFALARQPDGKVIAIGSAASPANAFAIRLMPDGNPDPEFAMPPSLPISPHQLLVLADGGMLLGGEGGIVALNHDGSIDTGFPLVPAADIYSLARQSKDRIFYSTQNVCRSFRGNGQIDGDYRLDGQVYAIVPLLDGRIFVGGSFTTLNDIHHDRFALLSPDGTVSEWLKLDAFLQTTLNVFSITSAPLMAPSALLQASTDLINWIPVQTNTLAKPFLFNDGQTGTFSRRFFRVAPVR